MNLKKILFLVLCSILSSGLKANENLRKETVEIAERAVNTIEDVDGATLDFSANSLKEIDRIVLEIRKEEGNDPEPFQHVLYMLGVYVGEVLLRNIDGSEWVTVPKKLVDIGAAQESEIWLKAKNGSLYNPIGKVYKLMKNGQENSVHQFYNYLKSKK